MLYGLAMSHGDIQVRLKDLYGVELSDVTLTAITDRTIPRSKGGITGGRKKCSAFT